MTPSTPELTDAEALAAALADDARERSGDCPELDQLADYLAGALAPEVEASIQDHLVACRTCTTQLLDLESQTEPGPRPAEDVTDLAVAAGWREQKSRIADLETARQRQRTLRWTSAVAASFFVATVGLSVHVSQLRQRIAGLEAPEVNVPIAYLDSVATRSGADAVTVTLAPEDRSILLTLTPTEPNAWTNYEVQVLSRSGKELWSDRGFVLSDHGTLRLRMPRAYLPAGDYEIQLHGLAGERRELLQEIPVLVRD